MPNFREKREALERRLISPQGVRAENSKGRAVPETESDVRTCFQRDMDRIIHSKSFRRLMHKTQVFLQPEGDHYRTRLTHTFEVSRIARTIARALELSEDLTEAIALGHDLGHTPFGHAGERAMNDILKEDGGFRHAEQSLRVVDRVEKDGRGLNLTYEVRDGILNHTSGGAPETLEGQVVRIADRAAYINHDVDDALRAGILKESDIPEEFICALGDTYSARIDTIIMDIITASLDSGTICMSPGISFVFDSFHSFMFQNVYTNVQAKSEEKKVYGILNGIFEYYVKNPDKLPGDFKRLAETDGLRRAVADYVSGMTDKYAVYQFSELFIPEAWQVR
ncbi:dGTPase [Sporobacter termitidis DSM 10068]|uniref:Deoxyguanosinetriphosphate triphosphohydrolase-like protein n=1 Tax=Sporobacter termitidis DSM 10068 TaxID=1123282 RepID=A0A1M5TBY1_9FIRM|nr:deoxyguanosinetriphosphate triphosphohydrolase [Sporobacter termitidis]SHH48214.1 dGTPase [Sporobacter termitidis DSM 10068]